MTRITIQVVLLAVFLAASTAPRAEDIRMMRQVPYADSAEIAENIRRECVQLQEQLSAFTREFAAEQGIQISLHDQINSDDPGRVLIVHIDDAVSMGNAFTGHKKFTRISGDLYQSGELVASFRARRNSGGGVFGGYKGSCSVLGRTVRTLGRDISEWLKNPSDGARLGDM